MSVQEQKKKKKNLAPTIWKYQQIWDRMLRHRILDGLNTVSCRASRWWRKRFYVTIIPHWIL